VLGGDAAGSEHS